MTPSEVPPDVLRAAVAASTTWRAVLPRVGVPSNSGSAPAALRARCDLLDIDYSHFAYERRAGTVAPSQVPEADLRAAVRTSRSWRGVVRALDVSRTSGHAGAALRRRCDALGIDYRHFTAERHATDAEIREAFERSTTWPELLTLLGYQPDNRTSRATTRSHLLRLGLDPSRLKLPTLTPVELPAPVDPKTYVRVAGSTLVAGALALRGHQISWPLEPTPFDLIATKDGRHAAVQVKTTTRKEGASWVCGITKNSYAADSPHLRRHVPYTAEEVDYFGIVTGDLGVYLVPVAVVQGLGTISVTRYERFRLATIQLHSDGVSGSKKSA